ncbi:MAG: diguanylate cyclase [bacterium]
MSMSKPDSVRILYMEDDAGLARLLQKKLQREGYAVDIAANGRIGLDMIDSVAYDIILVDYNMPEFGGLQVIQYLNARGTPLPTIMVTANGNEKIAVEAMKLGAADYIVKDADMNYLELLPIIIGQVISKQQLIKERQQMIQALQESEEHYRQLVELSPDGIAVHDEGKFIFINPGGAKLLGSSNSEELLGKSLLSFAHPACREVLARKLVQLEVHGDLMPWTEEKLVRCDGAQVDVEIAGIPFRYQGKQAVQVIFRDITDRKLAEQRLAHLALYDPLTCIPNRIMFFDRLSQALSLAKRHNYTLALLFLDLDRFKAVNDTLGHDMGDLLLKETAKRLTDAVRKSDTVARMGGDEFTIILTEIADVKDAGLVARKVIAALTDPFCLKNNVCEIGVSIGISLYPDDGDCEEILLKKADIAMYRVKECGKNNYQFYENRGKEDGSE